MQIRVAAVDDESAVAAHEAATSAADASSAAFGVGCFEVAAVSFCRRPLLCMLPLPVAVTSLVFVSFVSGSARSSRNLLKRPALPQSARHLQLSDIERVRRRSQRTLTERLGLHHATEKNAKLAVQSRAPLRVRRRTIANELLRKHQQPQAVSSSASKSAACLLLSTLRPRSCKLRL